MSIYDKKYDLLVFAEPMVQYIIESNDVTVEKLHNPGVGGEGIFVAATAAKHGFSSGICSVIAKDPYEQIIRNGLENHNINTDCCISDGGYNGIEIVCNSDNDAREFFYNRTASFDNKPISPKVNKELIDKCRTIYASSAFTLSSPEARSLVFESFHYAHHNKVFVAFDPNIRLHRHNITQLRETIWMLMPFIDFFSMTAASGEMQLIFGIDDAREVALNLLKKNVQYVAIRNGGEGVYFAFKDDGGDVRFGEIPVEKLDTGFFSYSGAVFNGAFISSILGDTNPGKAAIYATRYATQKCRMGNTLDTVFPANI